MKNKGFFWILTILLLAVSIYQISFTFISNNVEAEAEEIAQEQLDSVLQFTEGETVTLPNNVLVSTSSVKGKDSILNYYLEEDLRLKKNEDVHPFLDQNYDEIKNQSLNLGLDLKGGMSVTLELSVADLIKNVVTDNQDSDFIEVYSAAKNRNDAGEGDFIGLLVEEFNNKMSNQLIAEWLYENHSEIDRNMSNGDVELYLRKIAANALDGVENVINKRVNQFGVAQPNITKDPLSNRVMVELPGVKDRVTVRNKLKSTANLQFFEVYLFSELIEAFDESTNQDFQRFIGTEVTDSIIFDSTKTERTNLAEYIGFNGPTKDGGSRYNYDIIGISGVKDTAIVGSFFRSPKMREKFAKVEDLESVVVPMWSANSVSPESEAYFLHAVKMPRNGKAPVGGSDIGKAKQDYDERGNPSISFNFANDGDQKWYELTAANDKRPIAIVMDNIVYSAPNVNGANNSGSAQITGSFSVEDASGLADLLNGGSLPAPCKIVEESTVGATLAEDNIDSGLFSFVLALGIVLIYMIFYYGKAGIVANVALIVNMILMLGALTSFKAVLTLAGIAGIVLTIGMSVDANVLIFERIREELNNGAKYKKAIEDGYKKALAAILDANITTLLTAFVLKVFGSGPIESFATTLIIGIFTSVFSAVVVTRLILEYSINKKSNIKFSTSITKNWFKNTQYTFVKNRRKFYVFSAVLLVIGIGSLFIRGLDFGVEFTGGRQFLVEFEQEFDKTKLEKTLNNYLVYNDDKGTVLVKQKGNSVTAEITTGFMNGKSEADSILNIQINEGLASLSSEYGEPLILNTRTILPIISNELKTSSFIAIMISLAVIFIYILIRFGKWQYGLGALIAMAHDVLLVLAIFSIGFGFFGFSMEINQAFIAAILTVVGYSINDTVVVFDRIREYIGINKKKDRKEVINNALNSTLSRTVNTSLSTFLVLLMIFLFGGEAIKGFVFALMVGIVVGTYSSLCIATPTVIDLTKNKKIKEGDKA